MKKLMPKGFTIIEVIIVLVVGAVIMLAVFVVVPQLQRASRESQQRQIAQRVLVAARQLSSSGECALQNYANAKSDLPQYWKLNSNTDYCQRGIESVLGQTKNPATGAIYVYWTSTGSGTPRNLIYVFDNAKCNGNTPAVSSGSIAVRYAVEPYTGIDGDQEDGQPRCVSD